MFKSPLGREVSRIVLYGVGLGSICTTVYLVGPYIVIGGYRPFDNYIVTNVVIATDRGMTDACLTAAQWIACGSEMVTSTRVVRVEI